MGRPGQCAMNRCADIISIQPIKHGQRWFHIACGRHGAEMVFCVPGCQGVGAELRHQFVHAQAAALRQRFQPLRRVVG